MSIFDRIRGTALSRAGAAGLFLVLMILAAGEVAGYWARGLDTLRGERRRLETLAARLHIAVPESTRTSAEIDARLARLTIAAATPGQATARLQDDLKSLLAGAGAATGRLTIHGDRQAEGVPLLTATAEFRTDPEGLQAVLHALEAGTPRLIVSGLDIQTRGRDTRAPLSVTLTARVAARLPEEPPS